jgi:glutaredoxin
VSYSLVRYSVGPLVVLLLAVLAATSSPARFALPAEDPAPWHEVEEGGDLRVNLYVFWSETCPHCHRALRFLATLEEELPWLEVKAQEVSAPEDVELYVMLADKLGTDARYVPAFFYCGRTFQGYNDDATTGRFLRDSLEACHAELVAQAPVAEPRAPDQNAPTPGSPPIDLPLLGQLEPSALSLPVLTVLLAGLDAFNPCAFFVLLFLLSLMTHLRSRVRMALVGGVFVLCSGLVYFGFMAAWLNLFLLVGYLPLVTAAAGLVAVFVGTINVKDFIWFRRDLASQFQTRRSPAYTVGRGRWWTRGACPPC